MGGGQHTAGARREVSVSLGGTGMLQREWRGRPGPGSEGHPSPPQALTHMRSDASCLRLLQSRVFSSLGVRWTEIEDVKEFSMDVEEARGKAMGRVERCVWQTPQGEPQ